MKRLTASEARRNWFRLLDEVADGEVVVIERNGVRVLLQRQEQLTETPDYSGLLARADVERADEWSWRWDEDGQLSLDEPGEPDR